MVRFVSGTMRTFLVWTLSVRRTRRDPRVADGVASGSHWHGSHRCLNTHGIESILRVASGGSGSQPPPERQAAHTRGGQ
jgi:hypothetical protein